MILNRYERMVARRYLLPERARGSSSSSPGSASAPSRSGLPP